MHYGVVMHIFGDTITFTAPKLCRDSEIDFIKEAPSPLYSLYEMSDIKKDSSVAQGQQEQVYRPRDEKANRLPSYGESNAENEEYELPEFFDSEHMNWTFVFNEKFIKLSNLVFASDDDFRKYKSMKETKDHDQNTILAQLQHSGKAMPVLEVNYGLVSKAFIGTYLTVYKCTTPEKGRLFDRKHDRYEFCKVKATFSWQFRRYNFTFTPDPQDRSKSFEVIMVFHKRQQISDFLLFGERYRWLRKIGIRVTKDKWAYTLQKLPDNMPSMVDEFTDTQKSVNKEFKSSFLKSLFPDRFNANSKYLTNKVIGEVADTRHFNFIWNDVSARFSYNSYIPQNEVKESIVDVPFDALVFLCMSAVLKKVEYDREEDKRRNN